MVPARPPTFSRGQALGPGRQTSSAVPLSRRREASPQPQPAPLALPMPVYSTPADKPKIVFYGAMMAIQNFGFFTMYTPSTPFIPIMTTAAATCASGSRSSRSTASSRPFCLWMAMGGHIDSCVMFAFGWFLHLFVALPCCISSVGIPYVVYSDAGTLCRASMGTAGLTLVPVMWTHIALFLVYVWCMLSITYYSFLKATFITKGTGRWRSPRRSGCWHALVELLF